MTAAGLLLGSCAGLLAARRLCAISTRKRAGEGGPEAAQASWEREGSLHKNHDRPRHIPPISGVKSTYLIFYAYNMYQIL
jgi:hypothetical protein